MNDEKMKMDPSDKETLEKKCDEVLSWLDENPSLEKEQYDDKRKELEGVAQPLMQKMYQQSMPTQPSATEAPTGGPAVAEVD